MTSKNQRLNATITIGSVLEASVRRNVGFLKTGLNQVGNSIKEVERRQKELDRQRHVLRRQGKSVAHLDREYEKLERRLHELRRAQERWNRAIAASRRVGSSFNTMATDIGRNVRRIAIGASIAGGAIFGLAASTAELGDDVAKTADKLGIGTQELQELRYAAERSGVATSDFDKSLEKMTKNIGMALEGTGAQKDALDALGLSAEELSRMLPEEALGAIADRMQDIETQAERAAIANDIFGRSGIGMLNMLRDGSRGLAQLRDDARRTGYVLSEQAARDAEVFQDTLLDTKLVLKGLKNTVGSELMPVVTQAMSRVGDALLSNRKEVKRWAENFADGVERALPLVGEMALGVGRIGGVVWGVVQGTAEMVGGWENFGMIIGAVLASRTLVRIAKFGAAVFSLGKALFALARTTPLVVGGIRAIGVALVANPIGIAIAAIAGGAALIYSSWESVGPWFKERWSNVRQYFNGFSEFVSSAFAGDLNKAWDGIKTMWSGATAFWRGIWDGIGGIFEATWNRVIKPVTDALGLTQPIEQAWASFQTVIGSVFGAIGSIFETIWSSTIKPVIEGLSAVGGIGAAWESLKEAIGAVLDWLGQKFQWVWGIISPVIDGLRWVKEKGGAVLQGLGIGAGDTPSPSANLNSAPAEVGPNRRFALGGSFPAGPIVVGENGPELRYENRAGFIAHNRALRELVNQSNRVGSIMTPTSNARVSRAQTRPAMGRDLGNSERVQALFAPGSDLGSRSATATAPITQNITKNFHITAAGADAQEVLRLIKREERRDSGNGLFDRVPGTGSFGR